jgi:hypothetical protein
MWFWPSSKNGNKYRLFAFTSLVVFDFTGSRLLMENVLSVRFPGYYVNVAEYREWIGNLSQIHTLRLPEKQREAISLCCWLSLTA